MVGTPFRNRYFADAGPLNGKTPPILISVAVTPGASAANDDVDSASTSVQASLNFPNKTSSLAGNAWSAPATRVGSTRRGRCDRPACDIDYSSFLELVKRFGSRRFVARCATCHSFGKQPI